MSDIHKKAREMFDEKFPQAYSSCDGREGYDEEITSDIKDFIDQIIDLAIAERDKEIVEIIKNHNWGATDKTKEMYDGFATDIINLINSKKYL